MTGTGELTIHILQKHVKSVLEYLTPLLPMVNFPMVKFFVGQAWHTNIPMEIRQEIKTQSDIEEATDIYWKHLNADHDHATEKFKSFRSFLINTRKHHLDSLIDVWTTPDELLKKFNNSSADAPPIKGFMSIKKNHEVEIATDVIASICEMNQKKLCVIDAGDGKGYLSTRLSLEHNIKVLGVDCNPVNTAGALQRSEKLERFWEGMKTKAEELAAGEQSTTKMNRKKKRKERREVKKTTESNSTPAIDENYKNATYFITPQTNFTKLFSDHFDMDANEMPGLCLTGLHTCGNLAPSCLRIYSENEQISAVCNIGCCYHLLTEQFSKFLYQAIRRERSPESKKREVCESTETIDEKPIYGFPMSQYLINSKTELGRNARMAACQSVHRTIDSRERPNSHLFYRALLEVLIQRTRPEYLDRTEVGRMKQCNSFIEYVRKSGKRNPWLQFDKITDNELNDLYDEFKDERSLMDLYHLMRITVAAVVECALMLDRLLYLKENEMVKDDLSSDISYLVRFFDPVISPRNFGFVAIKEFQNYNDSFNKMLKI